MQIGIMFPLAVVFLALPNAYEAAFSGALAGLFCACLTNTGRTLPVISVHSRCVVIYRNLCTLQPARQRLSY